MNASTRCLPARTTQRRSRKTVAPLRRGRSVGGGGAEAVVLLLGLAAMAATNGALGRTPARPGAAAEMLAAGGWHAQTYARVRGIASVRPTAQFAHSGHGSLELQVHLDGSTAVLREGEAFVDLRYHPPASLDVPANLDGRLISAWVYAPPGLQGRASDPNGARLFVKDRYWHSEYGTWQHLAPGHWTRLVLTPSTAAPRQGFMSAGFNPRELVMLGVSLAVGGHSRARFSGLAFLDDVEIGNGIAYDFEPAPERR